MDYNSASYYLDVKIRNMKKTILVIVLISALIGCKNNSKPTDDGLSAVETSLKDFEKPKIPNEKEIVIHPVEHASMVLDWDGVVVYVDPVGEKDAFSKYDKPNLVLITDIHGDHFDITTLEAVVAEDTRIIAPKVVFDKLSEDLQKKTKVLNNGDIASDFELRIEAIPMYNMRPEAVQYHPKGRGNGYVLQKNDKRVYISGDTEDIPEMRNLKNIDIAFVCMNLPYTMPIDKAAEAVLAFKPKKVYPYHYRGTDGLSDVAKFKSLIDAKDNNIKVVQLDWYPNK